MSERIENLKSAIQQKVGGLPRHVESTPVKEVFRGETVWERVVETFDLSLNPSVKRCFAWSYTDKGETQYVTISATDEINSPQMAVKAYIASLVER